MRKSVSSSIIWRSLSTAVFGLGLALPAHAELKPGTSISSNLIMLQGYRDISDPHFRALFFQTLANSNMTSAEVAQATQQYMAALNETQQKGWLAMMGFQSEEASLTFQDTLADLQKKEGDAPAPSSASSSMIGGEIKADAVELLRANGVDVATAEGLVKTMDSNDVGRLNALNIEFKKNPSSVEANEITSILSSSVNNENSAFVQDALSDIQQIHGAGTHVTATGTQVDDRLVNTDALAGVDITDKDVKIDPNLYGGGDLVTAYSQGAGASSPLFASEVPENYTNDIQSAMLSGDDFEYEDGRMQFGSEAIRLAGNPLNQYLEETGNPEDLDPTFRAEDTVGHGDVQASRTLAMQTPGNLPSGGSDFLSDGGGASSRSSTGNSNSSGGNSNHSGPDAAQANRETPTTPATTNGTTENTPQPKEEAPVTNTETPAFQQPAPVANTPAPQVPASQAPSTTTPAPKTTTSSTTSGGDLFSDLDATGLQALSGNTTAPATSTPAIAPMKEASFSEASIAPIDFSGGSTGSSSSLNPSGGSSPLMAPASFLMGGSTQPGAFEMPGDPRQQVMRKFTEALHAKYGTGALGFENTTLEQRVALAKANPEFAKYAKYTKAELQAMYMGQDPTALPNVTKQERYAAYKAANDAGLLTDNFDIDEMKRIQKDLDPTALAQANAAGGLAAGLGSLSGGAGAGAESGGGESGGAIGTDISAAILGATGGVAEAITNIKLKTDKAGGTVATIATQDGKSTDISMPTVRAKGQEKLSGCNPELAESILSQPKQQNFIRDFENSVSEMHYFTQTTAAIEEGVSKKIGEEASVFDAVKNARYKRSAHVFMQKVRPHMKIRMTHLLKEMNLCGASAASLTPQQRYLADQALIGAGLMIVNQTANLANKGSSPTPQGCVVFDANAPTETKGHYEKVVNKLYGLWSKTTSDRLSSLSGSCAGKATAAERFYCESKTPRNGLPRQFDMEHQLMNCQGDLQLGKVASVYESGLRGKLAKAGCKVPEALLLNTTDASTRLMGARQVIQSGSDLKSHLGADYSNMGKSLDTAACAEASLYQASAALQLHPNYRGGTIKMQIEGLDAADHSQTDVASGIQGAGAPSPR